MKIKPLYLYGGIIVLAVAFLILYNSNNDSESAKNVSMNNIPNDDVHKGLREKMQPPGKENVTSEIRQKIELLKKAVEENPKDTLKLREYADLLTASHHIDEAIIYYNNILNIDPRRTDILFSIAYVYYNKKNYEKAESIINKILLYEPANTEAMYNLGAIAAARGDKVKAKDRWENLIKEYPDSKASKRAKLSLGKL